MPISLSQYRMTIGYFNAYKLVVMQVVIALPLLCINILYILTTLLLMLYIGGDIETNPGPHSSNCLNICHANIRSLSRAKLNAIKCSLTNIYDIITLSETHLKPNVPNDVFQLEGYHEIIRRDRQAEGGGVAI